ncbi:nucleotidyltransferase [Oceanobacillus polygoni]|uniref:Lincosamide nucleotidyltransferase n=1 Tax=Oceanobacillus polygoni TaxID=1235259 RepID=A0A9X1CI70_9BACI|nr:nucleotidyltransferase [Oceanobacillus polygoni]MBP2079165.1 lincosamide nucleotidyltransferase [Oceanobacillus polygoni]
MLFQQELINRVTKNCNKDLYIVSAMMYGSFTTGEGDIYSDVEFYIFIKDSFFKEFDSNEWISNLCATDLIYFNEYGTQVAIFGNLIRGEFHFLPQSRMNVIKEFKPTGVFPNAEKMFIYDSTNQLYALLDYLSGEGPDRKTNENVNSSFNGFVNYWIFGVNVLKRGEYARSLEILSHVQKQVLQAIRIKDDSVEHWLNSTKNLESDLKKSSYESYKSITANLEQTNLAKAYYNALVLMEKLYFNVSSSYEIDVSRKLLAKMYTHINE